MLTDRLRQLSPTQILKQRNCLLNLTQLSAGQTMTEALDRFGDWIIQCETVEELFERIRSSANGITG